jgi:hypothetical protein
MVRIVSTKPDNLIAVAALALGASFSAGLAGCGGGFAANTSSSSATSGAALHGSVHGGQNPISGASVYLYAAGTAGYGSAPASLLNTSDAGVLTDGSGKGYVATDSNGNWSITNDYSCPSGGSQVYLLALGGNPGLSAGTNNAAIAMMAALGSCSTLSSLTTVNIDEVTTILSAYALSPFANFSTMGIGASSTNTLGLSNAFSTVGNLVNLATGLALTTTPGGLGHIPQPEIDTLADILSTCVNSNGTTGECASLFTAATPSGGTAPANTFQAALNIARNPASNVTALFNLQPSPAPFEPVLPVAYNSFTGTYTGVPNDWSIAVVYASSAWSNPNGIAADSKGNIWLVSSTTVAKLDPFGDQLETVSGGQISANNYNQTIAIDLNDNALIDDNSYWVSEIDSLGDNTTLADTPPPLSVENIAGFGGVAVDASNNYWAGSAANDSSALVTFNNASGTGVNGIFTGGGLVNPIGVAIDYNGSVWLTNSSSAFANPGTVSKFSSAGAVQSGSTGFLVGASDGCAGIAIDASGNAWVTDATVNTLAELSNSGSLVSGSPHSGGGLDYPSAIAIDGAGNLWISNFRNSDITEFSSTGVALSPTLGFYDGLSSGQSGGITVDASGNVWTSAWSGYVSGESITGGVTETIGIAAPTVTPVALALKNKTIGTMP